MIMEIYTKIYEHWTLITFFKKKEGIENRSLLSFLFGPIFFPKKVTQSCRHILTRLKTTSAQINNLCWFIWIVFVILSVSQPFLWFSESMFKSIPHEFEIASARTIENASRQMFTMPCIILLCKSTAFSMYLGHDSMACALIYVRFGVRLHFIAKLVHCSWLTLSVWDSFQTVYFIFAKILFL